MAWKSLVVMFTVAGSLIASAALAQPVTVSFKLRASNPVVADGMAGALEAATGLSIDRLRRGAIVLGSYTYDSDDDSPDTAVDYYDYFGGYLRTELGWAVEGGSLAFVGGKAFELSSFRFTITANSGRDFEDSWKFTATLPNPGGEYDGLVEFGAAYPGGTLMNETAWPDAGPYRGQELYPIGSLDWGLYFVDGYRLQLTLLELNGEPLTPVAEPAVLGLLGLGAGVVAARRRRRA